MENRIPIKNIYYMICYVWDRLEQIVEIDTIESNEILDLFAMGLGNGINYLKTTINNLLVDESSGEVKFKDLPETRNKWLMSLKILLGIFIKGNY